MLGVNALLQTWRLKGDVNDIRIDKPSKILNSEQIIHLRNVGFTWSDVSALCGVSRMTLWRKTVKFLNALDIVTYLIVIWNS